MRRRKPLPPLREEETNTDFKKWQHLCKNDWVIYTLVSSVGALVFANSLYGEFVHDDIPAIVTNADVNGGNPVKSMFGNDFWGTSMSDPKSHKSYRPLTTLTFRLNYSLCGTSVWWWHSVNVLLHAVCCGLVARTGTVVVRLNRPFSALAGLLFAVHPIHTEAVTGVVGRADILACVFFLSSVLLYHGFGSDHRVWWSIAAAALGTFAKETGLTALIFNITFDIYLNWNKDKRFSWFQSQQCVSRVVRALCALIAIVCVRIALLQGALPAFSAQDNPPIAHPLLNVRIMTYSYLAAFNFWLLLCPWSLSHDWQMGSIPLVTSLWDPRNLLTCSLFGALLALVYRCLADSQNVNGIRTAACGLLLVLPFLPASNLLVTVGFVVAERVLYVSSVGFVFLTACGIQLLWQRTRKNSKRLVLIAAVAALVASSAMRTQLRNADWRTRETLLRADLATLPHNAKLHYNFGNFMKDVGQKENAVKHYTEALRLWPSYASAHNNLGTLVPSAHAEHHFLCALRHNPRHVNAHYNLAKLYRRKNLISEALRMLELCIDLEPRFVQAYIELLLLKPVDKRKQLLDKLLELEPKNWEHYVLYGNWYQERGLNPLALQYYTTAIQIAWTMKVSGLRGVQRACLLLRNIGQTERILQLLYRWYGVRVGGMRTHAPFAARTRSLRTELAQRARLYVRDDNLRLKISSTCIHHVNFEISDLIVSQSHLPSSNSTKDLNCQNNISKKTIFIRPTYKSTQNKSEDRMRRKSVSNNKRRKVKVENVLSSFSSEKIVNIF